MDEGYVNIAEEARYYREKHDVAQARIQELEGALRELLDYEIYYTGAIEEPLRNATNHRPVMNAITALNHKEV